MCASRIPRPSPAMLAVIVALCTVACAAADPVYQIITASDYVGSAPLNQLIAARQAAGLDVRTYVAVAGTTNTTIRNYIVSLWGTPDAPQYILIVGDTSGSSATTTTVPHFVGGGSKAAATDWPYGCMPGGIDWYPDIPVGRLSVQTVASLGNVVGKILCVESGNYPNPDYFRRGAFLSNADTQGQGDLTHDWVIDNYFTPNYYEGVRIYASQGGNTLQVKQAVNTGCLWTVYFGHSASTGWWDPSFYQADVNSLSNASLYGVAFGFSCNTAKYTESECFGETWLRAPMKGSAAYISASNYIYWGSADAWQPSVHLEKGFFASFFEDDLWDLGPAWQAGLYRFLKTYGGWDGDFSHLPPNHLEECRNFFEEFVILGDPAMALPHGDSFRLRATPEALAICEPSDAVYSLSVEQIGEFGEVVNLSAESLPPGTSASFSANNAVPPFTSVLTISGTGGSPPGDYSVVVRGVAVSVQRTQLLQLKLANGVPAATTLSSPAAGAVDVPLMPELVWEPVPQAVQYLVQVASEAGFADIVFAATTAQTSRTVSPPLTPLARYYWRVRAENGCGPGAFSTPRDFVTVGMLLPVAYDMPNGETGTYTYFDDTYNGSGNPSQPLSPLSGGVGDLTDGVIATQNWNQASLPYVGWHTVSPTILFHFAEDVHLNTVKLHVDDSNGGGGVYPPSQVRLTMGGVTLQFAVTDPPGGQPFALTFNSLGLQGTTLEAYVARTGTSYMMLSEFEFYGNRVFQTGDLNCDGVVDFDDINPFVLALSDPAGYTAQYPACNILNGDCNNDGVVNFDDINAFVSLLSGGL